MLCPPVRTARTTVIELRRRTRLVSCGAPCSEMLVRFAKSAEHHVTLLVLRILASAESVNPTFTFSFAFAFAKVDLEMAHEIIAALRVRGI